MTAVQFGALKFASLAVAAVLWLGGEAQAGAPTLIQAAPAGTRPGAKVDRPMGPAAAAQVPVARPADRLEVKRVLATCHDLLAVYGPSTEPGQLFGAFVGNARGEKRTYTPGAEGSEVVYGEQAAVAYLTREAALAQDQSQVVNVQACMHRPAVIK